MFSEVVTSALASVGGAAVIIAGFATFLGRIWTERITAQVNAKYSQELANLKADHQLALDQFNRKAEAELKDAEAFSGISREVYQGFFRKRISTYNKLLLLKNHYINDMHEEFITDQLENWGEVYVSAYNEMRKVMIENQLYVSTELDEAFHQLRMEVADYLKEADLVEALGQGADDQPHRIMEQQLPIYQKFAVETQELMTKYLDQISEDVGKLRSRIDLDKV